MPRDVKSASELSQTRSTKPVIVTKGGANEQLNGIGNPGSNHLGYDKERTAPLEQIVLLPHQVKAVETVGSAKLGVRLILNYDIRTPRRRMYVRTCDTITVRRT